MASSNTKSNSSNDHILTPNVGGVLTRPRFVVLHYTASTNLESTVKWLCDKRSKASAHVIIGRRGEVRGLVPFDRVAWHAGASSWATYNGLNKYSIGIELLNAGPVRKVGETYRTVVGDQIVTDVVEAKHRNTKVAYEYWQTYTTEQIQALDKLLGQLFAEFPSLVEIVGHDDISGFRGKTDPGPAFDEHMTMLKKKHDKYQD